MRHPRTALLALICGVGVLAAAPAEAQAPTGDARVSATGKHAELVERLPIGRKPDAKRRVIFSIPPSRLGAIAAGDRVEGMGDFEVTVCLKPDPDHDGDPYPCVGRVYGYNPLIKARVVLAPSATTTGIDRTMPVTSARKLRCSQTQPNRNHHCVLAIPAEGEDIPSTRDLPCAPASCYLNLVASASHQDARKGEVVVVGSNSESGTIEQNRGRLSGVLLHPGNMARPEPLIQERRRLGLLPIGSRSSDIQSRVLYSLELPRLRAGEGLVADGKAIASIGGHRYSAFTSAEMVLASSPSAKEPDRESNRVTGVESSIGRRNGFNCTQGSSAHPTPCVFRKVGIIKVIEDASGPLYLNLVVGMRAQFLDQAWDLGDVAQVQRGGRIKVYRYGP
jgi:hypothetical protein